MNNFEYYNPVRIVFGEGQIKQLAELVPSDSRVLITYGGGSAKRTGTLDEVKAALNTNGEREVFEFGGIEPNPEFTTLIKPADADLDQNAIEPIVKQLAEHGMTELGEHKANDLQVSRNILQRAAGKA